MNEVIIKSKYRVQDAGEVYTPADIVKLGISLIDDTICNTDAKILEPTCGNGNFIVGLLDRKLQLEKSRNNLTIYTVMRIISNIYGVDIKFDNICETKYRVIGLVKEYIDISETDYKILKHLLDRNIVWGNTLTSKQYISLKKLPRAELMFNRRGIIPKEIEENLVIVDWNIKDFKVNRVDYLYNNLELELHRYDEVSLLDIINQADKF